MLQAVDVQFGLKPLQASRIDRIRVADRPLDFGIRMGEHIMREQRLAGAKRGRLQQHAQFIVLRYCSRGQRTGKPVGVSGLLDQSEIAKSVQRFTYRTATHAECFRRYALVDAEMTERDPD